MGDELPALFQGAGLVDIKTREDDAIVERGDADFESSATIWTASMESMGTAMIAQGFWSESERMEAIASYQHYIRETLERQTLAMRSTVGAVRVPRK